MSGPVFLVAAAIACATVVMVVKTIAAAFTGRQPSAPELNRLQDQCDHTADLLHETQATLNAQATQIAELQERLDFTERLLTQARNRPALGAGENEG